MEEILAQSHIFLIFTIVRILESQVYQDNESRLPRTLYTTIEILSNSRSILHDNFEIGHRERLSSLRFLNKDLGINSSVDSAESDVR